MRGTPLRAEREVASDREVRLGAGAYALVPFTFAAGEAGARDPWLLEKLRGGADDEEEDDEDAEGDDLEKVSEDGDEGGEKRINGHRLAMAQVEALVGFERAREGVAVIHRPEESLLPQVRPNALKHGVD